MIKRTITFLIILGLFFVLSLKGYAENSCTKIPEITESEIKIKNFAKVDNFYYRGGQPNIFQFENLKKLGIKTIINLRKPFSFNTKELIKQKMVANSLGMNYINIPMNSRTPPSDEQIQFFFNILNNPAYLPVFVHCNEGKDRTGIMTALYRVRNYGWNFEQAYREMQSFGYHHILFPSQKHFLANYIKQEKSSQCAYH